MRRAQRYPHNSAEAERFLWHAIDHLRNFGEGLQAKTSDDLEACDMMLHAIDRMISITGKTLQQLLRERRLKID